jgi:topoisomerase-4 subunit B
MDESKVRQHISTHDWSRDVDVDHLAVIRKDPAAFAPGGVQHLILEVVAYAADEAEFNNGGRCAVTLHPDGSVSVADDGRGTATAIADNGQAVKKPVMSTKDLRFFDLPDPQLLPDGHPRRGISTVAALSEWLIHTNRRQNGAWTQRYEHGIPVTDLVPIDGDEATGTTGTTVKFRPDENLRTAGLPTLAELARLTASWSCLSVEIKDETAG